jgi:hypothetical protein
VVLVTLRAWGDESGSVPHVDPGAYLLSAVSVSPGRVDDVRDRMARLRRPAEKKLHWRGDSRARHEHVLRELDGAEVDAVVVVRDGRPDERPERQRRKCLEHFLSALGAIDHLTLESRGSALDRRDRDLVDALRASHRLGGLRVDHVPGPADPMLWTADAVCGAVVASRTGDPSYLDLVRHRVLITEVLA